MTNFMVLEELLDTLNAEFPSVNVSTGSDPRGRSPPLISVNTPDSNINNVYYNGDVNDVEEDVVAEINVLSKNIVASSTFVEGIKNVLPRQIGSLRLRTVTTNSDIINVEGDIRVNTLLLVTYGK
jgi:uncharacterized membrane protein